MHFGLDIAMVLLAAFGAGCIDAMVGGGGLIQLPALFAVFPNSAPPYLLGTSKFAGIFGTASAVARFAAKVHIPWRSLAPLTLLVLIASVSGALLATVVAPDVFRPLVPLMLAAMLLYMLFRPNLGTEHIPKHFSGSHHVLATALIVAIGFYDGFFGPGTGSLLMFVFVRFYGFDYLHASACARVLNVATNAAALVYFAAHGYVYWVLGIAMAVCNVAGATVGTRMALRGGSTLVRRIFLVVVSVLIVRTAWTATH
jgi:uncharacterized membrane protein YfcA